MHHASTFGLDARVRQCALQLQDQSLLAKLSVRDLIALEAKYHVQCLVSLYNRARQTKGSHEQEDSGTMDQGIALPELVAYIEDAHADNEYSSWQTSAECILPDWSNWELNQPERQDLQAHKEGRDIFLVFNKDVGPAMRKACKHDADSDAVHLARAANIVRREIFNKKESSFSGSYKSVPSIISAKFIGGISFYDPVWSQHQNPVKLHVDTPGSTDIVTATEVQQLCTMPRS